MLDKLHLDEKFLLFEEHWTPKIVAELNGQYVKIAKCKGELPWHAHRDEDELFLVRRGEFTLQLRDEGEQGVERTIVLREGDLFVVPRGVEHRPSAREEAWVVLFEPKSTAHTGEVESELTVHQLDWL